MPGLPFFLFPASAPGKSLLKVDNIHPTAAQCPVLVSLFLFPYQTNLGPALPLANRSTTADISAECGRVFPVDSSPEQSRAELRFQ